jgi:hypothetical protein
MKIELYLFVEIKRSENSELSFRIPIEVEVR